MSGATRRAALSRTFRVLRVDRGWFALAVVFGLAVAAGGARGPDGAGGLVWRWVMHSAAAGVVAGAAVGAFSKHPKRARVADVIVNLAAGVCAGTILNWYLAQSGGPRPPLPAVGGASTVIGWLFGVIEGVAGQ